MEGVCIKECGRGSEGGLGWGDVGQVKFPGQVRRILAYLTISKALILFAYRK